MTISLNTTEHSLNSLYADAGGCLPAIFSPSLTPQNLISLLHKHKNKPYSSALYELIAEHINANDEVLSELMDAPDFNNTVANAIATSGKASVDVLKRLLKVVGDVGTEHVKLSLFSKTLESLNTKKIESVLKETYTKDDNYSVSVRYLIASSPFIPKKILIKLTHDDYDHVSKAATATLDKLQYKR